MKIIHDSFGNEGCSYMNFFILVGYNPFLGCLFVYRFSIANFKDDFVFFCLDCNPVVAVDNVLSFIVDIEGKGHIAVVSTFGIVVDAADNSSYCRGLGG